MEQHYCVRIVRKMAYSCQTGVKTLLSTGQYGRYFCPSVGFYNSLYPLYELSGCDNYNLINSRMIIESLYGVFQNSLATQRQELLRGGKAGS